MAGLLRRSLTVRFAAPRCWLAPLLATGLAGCSYLPSLPSISQSDSFLGVITPYRMDIVQGNVVTKEQVALIKPGMGRNQVRDILGSPMLTDVFHANRWDYVFTIRRPGTEPQRRAVVAWFKDDKLDKLEAPDLPSEQEFVSSITRTRADGKKPVLELTPEEKQALPRPPKVDAPPADTPPPQRSYPPLEAT
ncbi:outer membrane protein assembly factor BamE [Aquabacterium sp. OR-4]|uniref:outer membrane protein assembly factor BamE n=1 Tax=Aquabacterium sp. OR-4 TaxID=2978127 RepID=UPI0021B447D6|nr:outer membrane protein assembly factor BamE [Aquabacterium sp. OR-4]MDT7834031.1 outer membrane protein assembly factor BamE [Aquabacterium sp. OR-4]